jgi:hypothetical protein
MEALLVLISVLTPIITALVAMLKPMFSDNYAKWVAVLPLVVGLICGVLWFPMTTDFTLVQTLWAGGLSGLAAGGFYSVQNIRNKE